MEYPIEQDSPIDPIDAQLMALLDDELSDEERESLEKRLVAEPELRRRLRGLQRSWEALDELPPKSVDQRFTSTTVEMVVTRASQELESLPMAVNAGRSGRMRLLAFCVLMFLLGGATVFGYRRWQYRNQLRDLEIVERLDSLMHVDDVDFIRDLSTNEAWQKHVSEGITLGRIRARGATVMASLDVNERLVALHQMDDAQRNRLKLDWEDWTRLPSEQQQAIRSRYQHINAESDSQQLLDAARSYAMWLESLSPVESSRIASVSTAERLAYIINKLPSVDADWREQVDDEYIRQFVTDLVA